VKVDGEVRSHAARAEGGVELIPATS